MLSPHGRARCRSRGRSFAGGFLLGAGLFLRTVYNLETLDSGFDRNNVLLAVVQLSQAGYSLPFVNDMDEEELRAARAKLVALYTELHGRFEALPGVKSATWSYCGLMMGCSMTRGDIRTEGFTPAPDENLNIRYNSVGPRYFETMGIEFLAGRDFTLRDNASSPLVAIVNRAA